MEENHERFIRTLRSRKMKRFIKDSFVNYIFIGPILIIYSVTDLTEEEEE